MMGIGTTIIKKKTWLDDLESAKKQKATKPYDPNDPPEIDTNPPPDEDVPPDEEPPEEEDPEEIKSWFATIIQGAWEVFKDITGISTWQHAQKILDDPNLDISQKRQRIQYLAAQSVFDLVGAVDIPGLSGVTKMAENPVRSAIKKAGEKLFSYMQQVGRYAKDLTPLQRDIISKIEKRVLNAATSINKRLSSEITNKYDRAKAVLSRIPISQYIQEAKDEFLEILSKKTESPPNEFMAVVGSRTFDNETAVHSIVKRLLDNGYGIASGGATGADHYALTGVVKLNPRAGKIFTVGTRHYVNQEEVGSLTELLAKGGTIKVGSIQTKSSYHEYVKALFKRTDDMVNDNTVKGVVAFLDPAADNAGTWYTIEAAIAKGKRVIVHTKDEKVLKELPDGYWHKMYYNQDAYQWVVDYSKTIITYVNEAGVEISKYTDKDLIKNGNWMVREVIKKEHGSPGLIVRADGEVVKFPKTGAQLQDYELLVSSPSSLRTYLLTQEGKTHRFLPEGEDPLQFTVKEFTGDEALKIILDGQVDTETSFPKAIRNIYGSDTVEVRSIEEAIKRVNPDQRPQFTNDLERMIWEGYMNSKGTMAFREDIAQEPAYRRLVHIMTKTEAKPAQANAFRKYWDILGDTPELYKFHYEEVQRFIKESGSTESGIQRALDHYKSLAEELEKVTKVSEDDVMNVLEQSYKNDDILGFDKAIDDYEKMADISYPGDDIAVNLDADSYYFGQGTPKSDMFTDDGDIRTWIPLGELEDLNFSRPPWLSQQPRWYQDLIKAIEDVTPDNVPALGKQIYSQQTNFTKDQKAVAFEYYFRAKTRVLEQVERSLKSDAQKLRRDLWQAKSRTRLAQIGEQMYQAQKQGQLNISPQEWTILWKAYQQRKKILFGQ